MAVTIKKQAATSKMRLDNLHLLVYEYGTKAKLASALGMQLGGIAEYFKKKPAPVTDDVAKAIEKKLAKPLGWMDRKNYDLALTSDEWLLLDSFRAGSDRDRIILASLANTLGAMPQK